APPSGGGTRPCTGRSTPGSRRSRRCSWRRGRRTRRRRRRTARHGPVPGSARRRERSFPCKARGSGEASTEMQSRLYHATARGGAHFAANGIPSAFPEMTLHAHAPTFVERALSRPAARPIALGALSLAMALAFYWPELATYPATQLEDGPFYQQV